MKPYAVAVPAPTTPPGGRLDRGRYRTSPGAGIWRDLSGYTGTRTAFPQAHPARPSIWTLRLNSRSRAENPEALQWPETINAKAIQRFPARGYPRRNPKRAILSFACSLRGKGGPGVGLKERVDNNCMPWAKSLGSGARSPTQNNPTSAIVSPWFESSPKPLFSSAL